MGEWTWLHVRFPIADVELMQPPIDAKSANVLVRTIRQLAPAEAGMFEVRVAPHNVAPFKGGPWLCRFAEADLEQPGEALYTFRSRLAQAVERARADSMKPSSN